MKRICLVILPLAGVFLFLITACNKDEEISGTGDSSSNTVVYEDKTIEEEVSPYFYDNHIYRIERLGENLERDRLLYAALEKGMEEDFLLIEEAQKYFFNHTGVIMYSIPTGDPEQTVIIYETMGLFQVAMAHCRPAEKGCMSFSLKTMDDHIYFSLKLDKQNRIGDLEVYENEEINSFNNAVYSLTYREESQDASSKSASAICCRKESSWKACMNCTLDDCADSWICKAAALIAPAELVAGIAASCIGAGPDARC